jgi:hypothetical protein
MKAFKTKVFAKWARKERLADGDLSKAITEIAAGLVDARLGGSLVKKRVAAAGRGKSGGYRTIVAYRARGHAFFLYGFAKNERDNIEPDELAALKKLAKVLQSYSESQIAKAVKAGVLLKVKGDEQD